MSHVFAVIRRRGPRRTSLGQLAIVSAICVAFAGCNQRAADLAPVAGVVELDGKPLTGFQNGGVVLTPKGGRLATGVISPTDGTFELTTYEKGDGAKLGAAVIAVSATVDDPAATDKIEGRYQQLKSIIPQQFSDHATSQLTYDVVDGENFLRIKLSSDGSAVIESK